MLLMNFISFHPLFQYFFIDINLILSFALTILNLFKLIHLHHFLLINYYQ
jgi:hypothetical protein